MIARVWSARTTAELGPGYLEHFRKNVTPDLRKVPGFAGFTVATRPLPSGVEVLVTTFWQSWDAIDAFAGADREAAVVAPEAEAFLADFDRRVRHYEVALADIPPGFPSL
jgi:heme-degrading monooxygenase HmoA